MAGTTPTKPLPTVVREKLGRLLPLLASGYAGEQAATLAAVGRLLEAYGLNWFDFSAAITGPAPAAPPPRSPPPTQDDERGTGTSLSGREVVKLVNAVRASKCYLSPRSEEFLESMLERAHRYPTIYVSQKQLAWLADLARKAGLGV
jgi:hypothetical protein